MSSRQHRVSGAVCETMGNDGTIYQMHLHIPKLLRGKTISRLRTGAILHQMHSHLPEGGPVTCSGGTGDSAACILDCIYHEPNR